MATRLEAAGAKGVASLRLAAFEAFAEPAHALGRGAMGERFRYHATLCLALQGVIADRRSGPQAVLDVARFQARLYFVVETCPHTRQAVGLQLHAHLQGID